MGLSLGEARRSGLRLFVAQRNPAVKRLIQ
jgi:hypothetical protein